MEVLTKKAIAIVVALVVLVAAGGFGVYYYFTNTPKNKYLLSEKKSYEDVSNYLSERYKDEMALSNKMPNESYKSSITLGAELPETLTSGLGIPADLIKSSKIELSAAHDPKNSASQLAINPTIGDSKMDAFVWSADAKYQYLQGPILKNPLQFNNDQFIEGLEKLTGEKMSTEDGLTNDTLNLNSIMSTPISQDELNDLVNRYMKFTIDQLNDDLFKKGSEEVDVFGKKQKLDTITLDMKNTDVKNLTIAVVEEASNDKDLQKLLKQSDATIDVKKELQTVLKSLKETKAADFPAIKSIIYVDGKTILKRDIVIGIDEEKLHIVADTKVDKEVQLKVVGTDKEQTGTLTIEGSSTGSKDFKDDYTIKLSDQDTPMFEIQLTNDEKVDGKKRTNAMALNFTAPDEDPFKITYDQEMTTDVKNNSQDSKGTVAFDVQGENIKLFVDTKTKLKEPLKLDVPNAKNVNDMTEDEVIKLREEVTNVFTSLFMGLGGL